MFTMKDRSTSSMICNRVLGVLVAVGLGATGIPGAAAAGMRTGRASYRAAPSADDKAQQRYQAGLEAFEAGRFGEAAAAFEEAFELAGDPTLLYNVSIAYEKAGKLDEALEALDQYAELAPDSERADIERQRKALVLRIEKSQQEAEQDPSDEPETTAPPQEPAKKKARGNPQRDKPVPERVFTPAAISMVSLSVVALGVGTGLAIPAARADGRVEQECVDEGSGYLCRDTDASLVRRRRGLAIGADVSFGIGIVAGIAAIALLATNATRIRRARRSGATAVVSPSLGRASASVSLTTRF